MAVKVGMESGGCDGEGILFAVECKNAESVDVVDEFLFGAFVELTEIVSDREPRGCGRMGGASVTEIHEEMIEQLALFESLSLSGPFAVGVDEALGESFDKAAQPRVAVQFLFEGLSVENSQGDMIDGSDTGGAFLLEEDGSFAKYVTRSHVTQIDFAIMDGAKGAATSASDDVGGISVSAFLDDEFSGGIVAQRKLSAAAQKQFDVFFEFGHIGVAEDGVGVKGLHGDLRETRR